MSLNSFQPIPPIHFKNLSHMDDPRPVCSNKAITTHFHYKYKAITHSVIGIF